MAKVTDNNNNNNKKQKKKMPWGQAFKRAYAQSLRSGSRRGGSRRGGSRRSSLKNSFDDNYGFDADYDNDTNDTVLVTTKTTTTIKYK